MLFLPAPPCIRNFESYIFFLLLYRFLFWTAKSKNTKKQLPADAINGLLCSPGVSTRPIHGDFLILCNLSSVNYILAERWLILRQQESEWDGNLNLSLS